MRGPAVQDLWNALGAVISMCDGPTMKLWPDAPIPRRQMVPVTILLAAPTLRRGGEREVPERACAM
jgi:hypothetical protein